MGHFKQLHAELHEIINNAAEYEDGETGTDGCIEMYCEEHGIPDEKMVAAQQLAFRIGAIEAGIPVDVVDGKRNLTLADKGPDILINIELGGVDYKDYPDLVDSFIDSACWPNGTPLTDSELDELNENYSDFVHELAILEVAEG